MLCIAYVNFINNLLCSLNDYFRMEKITIKSPSGVYREEKVAYPVKKKSARIPVEYGKLVVTF